MERQLHRISDVPRPQLVDNQPRTGVGSPEVRAAGMDAMMLASVVLNHSMKALFFQEGGTRVQPETRRSLWPWQVVY